jgi:hypothetical protein
VYDVIGEPLVEGEVQDIRIVEPLMAVVGAEGCSGAWAAKMPTLSEKTLYPKMLRDMTLNL